MDNLARNGGPRHTGPRLPACGATGADTVPMLYECADGYVVLIPCGATMSKAMDWLVANGVVPEEWIEGEGWTTYERRLLQGGEMTYGLDEVVGAMRRFARPYTKTQLLESGLDQEVTVAPISTMEDLTRFRHLEERGCWITAPLPNGKEVNSAGQFTRFSGTPTDIRHWPPTLGQHNQNILEGMLEMDSQAIAAATQSV